MTLPSRRKRQTTVRGATPQAPKLASVLALCLCLLSANVHAQYPGTTTPQPVAATLSSAVPQVVQPAGPSTTTGQAQPVQYRTPGGLLRPEDSGQDFEIRFDLPGPELLFRLDSEDAMIHRLKQERRKNKKEELTFPDQPVLAKEAYRGRDWPRLEMNVEPHYVCHGRLHFEQINVERYGWELGIFQPAISLGLFVKDVALLPLHAVAHPRRCYDCNAGKCLPGDPVPLLLYPPELTLTGTAAEVGVIAALIAIFP